MNQRRKHENKRINSELRSTESHVIKARAAIVRLTAADSDDPVFTGKQITKLKVTIERLEGEMEDLRDREGMLRRGCLDDELRADAKAVQDELDDKKLDKQKKKDKEAAEDTANKVTSQAYWDATVKSERNTRYAAKNMLREYNFYTEKLLHSMPRYMTENLRKLPENKGYIWKGIYNYGERPAQSGRPTEMEEQLRGKGLIHEWTKQKDGTVLYRRFEKIGKGRDMRKHLALEEVQYPIPWASTSAVFWK